MASIGHASGLAVAPVNLVTVVVSGWVAAVQKCPQPEPPYALNVERTRLEKPP